MKDSQEALLAVEEIYIEDLGKSDEYLDFLESIPGIDLSNFSRDSISYKTARIQYENGIRQGAHQGFHDVLLLPESVLGIART